MCDKSQQKKKNPAPKKVLVWYERAQAAGLNESCGESPGLCAPGLELTTLQAAETRQRRALTEPRRGGDWESLSGPTDPLLALSLGHAEFSSSCPA